MSRIGNKPIILPEGVEFSVNGHRYRSDEPPFLLPIDRLVEGTNQIAAQGILGDSARTEWYEIDLRVVNQ